MRNTLAVIPARGGSKTLRRKNLLPDPSGTPLFLVSAQAAREAGCAVVVSTDDEEIGALARTEGFRVHPRGPDLADVPVDVVVAACADDLEWDGPVLLVQPTVQPMTADLIRWCLAKVYGTETSAAFGVEDRHLTWMDGWLRTPRVQRQDDAAWPVREVGVRWWPGNRVSPPSRVITSPHHLVDIDTADDYRTLERRLNIQFEIVASPTLGHGHLRRALTLAEGLQHHDVRINSHYHPEALPLLGPWEGIHQEPDVVVYDSLDKRCWYTDGVPTVALETTLDDATVTINAMYGHGDYTGSKYAVLRPEFTTGHYEVREEAERVMVMFGGTDPSDLTRKAVGALHGIELDVIVPEQHRHVAGAMRLADLLITSGGRTVFEAAAVGVPTLVLAQNVRELSHTHLGIGNLSLGLGRLVTPEALLFNVESILDDFRLRSDLSETARGMMDMRGADRVRRIIEHVATFGEKR